MMLARVGALAAQRRASRPIRLATASVVAAGAAAVSWNTVNTSADNGSLIRLPEENQVTKLLIPTVEASVRVLRLLKTAVLIVMDYESAKVMKLFPTTKDEQVEYWEELTETRRTELEHAQLTYTSSLDISSPELKRKIKQEQKEAMHLAAERLAEAEHELAQRGGQMSRLHRKAAERLLKLCHDNGGVYIKIGQHLANLDYLIPQEYIEVLSSLFNDAPLTSFEDVCRVIQEDLGGHPDEIFASFDPEPIASASLAQVHVAFDAKSGRKLAVKVQHRGLRETSAGDIFAVTAVVRALEAAFKDFTWGWIADEIAPQLPKELDFINEGRNAEKASEHMQKTGLNCIIPKIIWNKTTPRVLTMEFEEGFKATDEDAIAKAGLQKRDVAKLVSSVFNSQVFLSAFVHCDPHPGNALIREVKGEPMMVLVDHGLYKEIDDDFRVQYAKLWQALMMADLNGIKDACYHLGVDEMYTLFAAMLTARPFDEMIERSKTGSLSHSIDLDSQADKAVIRGYAQAYLQDIFELLGSLPRQMLLLLKMNDCLRHIDYSLGSPTNTLVVAGQFAARATYEERLKRSRSISERFKAWCDYMAVVWRIRLHDVGVWWLQQASNLSLSKLIVS